MHAPARLFLSFLLGLFLALPLRAELQLRVRNGDAEVPTAQLGGWQGGLDRMKFSLEGELQDLDELAYWWPEYRLLRSSVDDLDKYPDTEARLVLSLQAKELTDSQGKVQPSQVGEIWPGLPAQDSLLLAVWLVDGKPSQVIPLRPGGRKADEPAVFQGVVNLDVGGLRGYPVLLAWRAGHFVKATPFRVPSGLAEAFRAVVKDDATTLSRLLDAGLKGDVRDLKGRSLAEHAALSGAVACLEVLKARKVSFKPARDQQRSALELAAERGRSPVVKFLLDSGLSTDGRDPSLDSPLYLAAVGGHLDAMEALLARRVSIDETTHVNVTALVGALNEGQLAAVELLLRKRAHIDFASENCRRVFLSVCREGRLGLARFYLSKGLSAVEPFDGGYPLIWAAFKGNAAFAELLLKAGASVDVQDHQGDTALMVACLSGNSSYARALLAAGAKVAVQSKAGQTPLHAAIFTQKYELVKELLAAGAPTTVKNRHGLTPLDFAVLIGAWECVEPFVKAGARLDPKAHHISPITESLLRGDQAELLAQLLQDGLPADFKGTGGWPLRRLAQLAKAERCVAILDEAGAKWDERVPDVFVRGSEIDPGLKFLSGRPPADPRPEQLAAKGAVLKVRVLVDSKGQACFTLIDECVDPLLCLGLFDTVDTWRFTPPTRGGKPVATWVQREIKFPSAKERREARPVADQMPQPIRQVPPEYPTSARMRGQTAQVLLAFTVDEKGEVINARVVRTSGIEFNKPALDCVKQWKFKPGKAKGVPVPVDMQVPIFFSLN